MCSQSIFFWGGGGIISFLLYCRSSKLRVGVDRPPGPAENRVATKLWMAIQTTEQIHLFFRLCCVWFIVIQMRCNNRPACFIVGICPCLAVASFDITCRSPFIKVLKRGKSQQMFVYNSRRCLIIIETNVIHSFVQTLNTFDCLCFFTTFEFSWSKRF